MKVLELHDVTRAFPGPVPVKALKMCSSTVNDGDMMTTVDHSGSDKPTLLNLAGLLDRPSSGAVLVNDLGTTKLSEFDRTALRGGSIGFVFQVSHLMPHRSVTDNITLAGLYQGVPAEERKEASRRAIDLVGLDHRNDSLAGLLSGGERQRVAIARTTTVSPIIPLYDESTGNFDSINFEVIVDLLTTLNGTRATVVIITHNPEIVDIGNLRLRLHNGVVIRDAA